jgi:Protein of unknown function (DUF1203)
MHFRIQGLPAATFAPLFALSDDELAQQGAVRQIADGPRPCRISLTDAKPGDELILVNYEHHAVASPYRMRFAIYVRKPSTPSMPCRSNCARARSRCARSTARR